MKKFVLRSLANMLGIYAASLVFPAIVVASPAALFAAGLVLAVINMFIRPLLLLVSLPVNIVTLGLFTLVINAWMVMLAAYFVNGLVISGFLLALATAFLIWVGNMVVDAVAGD
jgi:putative membrane protein